TINPRKVRGLRGETGARGSARNGGGAVLLLEQPDGDLRCRRERAGGKAVLEVLHQRGISRARRAASRAETSARHPNAGTARIPAVCPHPGNDRSWSHDG